MFARLETRFERNEPARGWVDRKAGAAQPPYTVVGEAYGHLAALRPTSAPWMQSQPHRVVRPNEPIGVPSICKLPRSVWISPRTCLRITRSKLREFAAPAHGSK